MPTGVERLPDGTPIITRRSRANSGLASVLPLPNVGDMVVCSAGGWLHEHFFVGRCAQVDEAAQTYVLHFFNRYNDAQPIRRQLWAPAYYIPDGREIFTFRPSLNAKPVTATIRRSDTIASGFELNGTQGVPGALPAKTLHTMSESPLTVFLLD